MTVRWGPTLIKRRVWVNTWRHWRLLSSQWITVETVFKAENCPLPHMSAVWGLDKDGPLQNRETGLPGSNQHKAAGESAEIECGAFVITALSGHSGHEMKSRINQEVISLMKGGINQLKCAISLTIHWFLSWWMCYKLVESVKEKG